MGRYSQWLHKGKRKPLWKLMNEFCTASKTAEISENREIEDNIPKNEEKVVYDPFNRPHKVIFMHGLLEIRPSTLKRYINELYKHK